ncbi:hypothetical protein MHYP_G00124890 [Metynnis hypsauchen]
MGSGWRSQAQAECNAGVSGRGAPLLPSARAAMPSVEQSLPGSDPAGCDGASPRTPTEFLTHTERDAQFHRSGVRSTGDEPACLTMIGGNEQHQPDQPHQLQEGNGASKRKNRKCVQQTIRSQMAGVPNQ